MSFLCPTSLATTDAFEASWMHQPIVYLVGAGICLVVVLRFLRRALVPIGALIQAVAAAAIVAFAAVLAVAMLVIAAVTSVR
ncbi:MAG TPA: hypothetical protein VGD29_24600 [Actinoplanes sp.]|jgi:hypothetical protein